MKHLYKVLRASGMYKGANPLISAELERELQERVEAIQTEYLQTEGRRSPANSGGVDDQWRHRLRYSTNYFQLKDGEWRPRIIADPRLHVLVYKAGRRFGWSLREEVIARILFETGARGFEAVERTLSDWLVHGCLAKLESSSKCSEGVRVKTLVFKTETANLLRRYWDTERTAYEVGPYKSLAEFQKAVARKAVDPREVPIFLSHTGRPYSISTFRDYYWNPALDAAGLQCQIHQTRHWFVTQGLALIDKLAIDELDRQRRREQLVKYMKWRSGAQMLAVYDHSGARIPDHLHEMHTKMARLEGEYKKRRLDSILKDAPALGSKTANGEAEDDFNFIVGIGDRTGGQGS